MAVNYESILKEYYRLRGKKLGISDKKIEFRLAYFSQYKKAHSLLKTLGKYCADLKQKTFLDVGAGPGVIVKPLDEMGYSIIGLEYDKLLADLGNKWIGKKIIETGSVYEIPFSNDKFNIIICHDVLEHLKDPLKAVHEMFRVCKPGGCIYIVSPNKIYPREAHYDIYPFPNILPKRIGSLYLKLLGRDSSFFEKNVFPLTYFKIRKMISQYTEDIICLNDVYILKSINETNNVIKKLVRCLRCLCKYYSGLIIIAKKPVAANKYSYSLDTQKFINKLIADQQNKEKHED